MNTITENQLAFDGDLEPKLYIYESFTELAGIPKTRHLAIAAAYIIYLPDVVYCCPRHRSHPFDDEDATIHRQAEYWLRVHKTTWLSYNKKTGSLWFAFPQNDNSHLDDFVARSIVKHITGDTQNTPIEFDDSYSTGKEIGLPSNRRLKFRTFEFNDPAVYMELEPEAQTYLEKTLQKIDKR